MDCSTFAFDLHVLGTPPALILSQDQTLKLNSTREPSCMALLLFGYCLYYVGVVTRRRSHDVSPPADSRRVDACTFYLVFKEPAFHLAPSTRFRVPFAMLPSSYISFGGTLQS